MDDNITDEGLAKKVISDQVSLILLQDRYVDNPLAMPSLTPEAKSQQDAEWWEAIRRGLNEAIHIEIKRQVKLRRAYREEMESINIISEDEWLKILRKMYDDYFGG